MFESNKPRQIDLHLPTGWNSCTTEELEAIAAAIISEQQRVDRYHPFDWSRVKISVVLAINSLTPDPSPKGEGSSQTSAISHQTSDIESTWLVRRPEDKEPWPITTGQLVALTERLAWIDDEKASKTIFQFPYPELTLVHGSWFMVHGSGLRVKGSGLRVHGSKSLTINREPLTVAGPPPLLDGYTWQEYRWMTDWMQAYMRHSNALLQVKSEKLKVKSQQEAMENARNEFLAVLFKPKAGGGRNNDISTYRDNDKIPAAIFTSFDPVKWQVILFWWSSLMSMLAKKFPKVFKQQPVGKGKRRPQQQDTPWDFYNRVTATIQKYIGGLSEQDVNNATYGTILQQLEMMADEAAEMEKLKHKK